MLSGIMLGAVLWIATAVYTGLRIGRHFRRNRQFAAAVLPQMVNWELVPCAVRHVRARSELMRAAAPLAHGSAEVRNPKSSTWESPGLDDLIGPKPSDDAVVLILWFRDANGTPHPAGSCVYADGDESWLVTTALREYGYCLDNSFTLNVSNDGTVEPSKSLMEMLVPLCAAV